MKAATCAFLSVLVLGACSLAAPTSQAATGIGGECAKGNPNKVVTKEYENKMVSLCSADCHGDCQYAVTSGKTFLDSRLHLNADRLNDDVIKDFSAG
jgi:hypothetical protein